MSECQAWRVGGRHHDTDGCRSHTCAQDGSRAHQHRCPDCGYSWPWDPEVDATIEGSAR